MKVIHLISGGDTGGAKTHVHSLLAGLSPLITVKMVCFTEGPFAQEARNLGIDTEVIPGRNLPRILRHLERMIRTDGYEIIHCHGARGNLMGSILYRRLGIPTVSTVHSDYRLDYLGRPLSRITYGTVNTIALRRIPYHIGVSDAMVDLLISRGFDPESLFPIYNGLDFAPRQAAMSRQDFFRSIGLNADDSSVVVGIAARLNPVKDISTLIRGFAKAHREFPALRLLIAGEGEELDMLKRLAEELGVANEVCFAGWISDTDTLYRSLDINTLTSLSETFPYALTEGAREALPTVSSQVGGVPYLIDHGVNGFLFPVGDADALAGHLLTLARDPQLRSHMGQRLYDKAKQEFSLEATVSRQLEIYRTILRRRKKRNQVLICGAYGKGNAGDDAILLAVLAELRELDPDVSCYVLSRNPRETCLTYRVNSIYTFSFWRVLRQLHRSNLYLNGGGSLMQDVTSWRSLWFYLWTLYAAKRQGCAVVMYGCGIGPIYSPLNRALAARIINGSVDAITLRDPHSQSELEYMEISNPDISLSADPTVILPAAAPETIDGLFESQNLDPNGSYIAFLLRPWSDFDQKIDLIARVADSVYETLGLIPIFFPIEPRLDMGAAQKVAAQMKVSSHIFSGSFSTDQTIGILSRMRVVVSMRLHGLIFAASQGVPLVGIVYDQKVSSFLSYIGQNLYTDLRELTEETLKQQITAAYHLRETPALLLESVERLRRIEEINRKIVASYLDLSSLSPEEDL